MTKKNDKKITITPKKLPWRISCPIRPRPRSRAKPRAYPSTCTRKNRRVRWRTAIAKAGRSQWCLQASVHTKNHPRRNDMPPQQHAKSAGTHPARGSWVSRGDGRETGGGGLSRWGGGRGGGRLTLGSSALTRFVCSARTLYTRNMLQPYPYYNNSINSSNYLLQGSGQEAGSKKHMHLLVLRSTILTNQKKCPHMLKKKCHPYYSEAIFSPQHLQTSCQHMHTKFVLFKRPLYLLCAILWAHFPLPCHGSPLSYL